MATLKFGEWRPDASDINGGYTQRLRNVTPRSDGYGPFNSIGEFTQALPDQCRGYFVANLEDGTVVLFAGTSEKLYMLDNTTLAWTDVSNGSGYTALPSDANWVFAQFNNVVIATQRNDDMQKMLLGTDVDFTDLGGSPPRAGWVSVVSRFLVATDLANDPLRVQWSGLNEIDNWTAGTNSSDYQDLPDGGRGQCVAEIAGDIGIVLQEAGARRMTFAAGSEYVFQIDRLQNVPGTIAPHSFVVASGGGYYLSPKGFVQVGPDGSLVPIGEERFDRTFLGQLPASAPSDLLDLACDLDAPQLIIGTSDPSRNLVVWGYKAKNDPSGVIGRGLIYHTVLKRASPVEISAEYITRVAKPGLTLEALDAIAPGAIPITGAANNGSGLIRLTVGSTASLTTGDFKTISGVGGTVEANGDWTITVINGTTFDLQGSTFANAYTSGGVVAGSLDDLPFSLDDVSTATLPALSAVNASRKAGFFDGPALEAELLTAEQSLDGWRININGIRPFTDAPSVFCSAVMRDTLYGAEMTGIESEMDMDGYCPLLDETRFARARVRIPAGIDWQFVSGVESDISKAGRA